MERLVRMFALERMRFGIVSAAFSCLIVGYAVAQEETQTTGRSQSSEARRDTSDQFSPGQTDRPATQQRERSGTEGSGRSYQSSQRQTPNIRGPHATAGGANQEVEQFLASCLLAKNQSEVELSQFAQEQAENPEVKQFAQKMVQDHQKMIQQLQQFAGNQSGTSRSSTDSQFGRTSDQADRSGTSGDPSLLGTNNQSGDANQPVGATSQRSATNGSTSVTNRVDHGARGSSDAIQTLMQIDRQIIERQTQAVREELQQKLAPSLTSVSSRPQLVPMCT